MLSPKLQLFSPFEKNHYQYKQPLVGNNNQALRGYTIGEMTRIIEITESAIAPNKNNARDIPVFLFYEKNRNRPEELEALPINIMPGMNKYYALLSAASKYPEHPDTPHALQNSIGLHLFALREEIARNLPMTVVYMVGMNDNHVGTVAVRITSDNPIEIMVINSLGGYENWEKAAISGITSIFPTGTSFEFIHLTPAVNPAINQAAQGMKSSCAGITAAMACAISPDVSFVHQQGRLKEYMKSLCGLNNEALLRRDHEKVLKLPHPLDDNFKPGAVKEIVRQSQRHGKLYGKISQNTQNKPNLSKNNPLDSIVDTPESQHLFTIIKQITQNTDFWQPKTRGGNFFKKIPAGINSLSMKNNLSDMIELANYKHSDYFRLHNIFRGRDKITNDFYKILSDIDASNINSLASTISNLKTLFPTLTKENDEIKNNDLS